MFRYGSKELPFNPQGGRLMIEATSGRTRPVRYLSARLGLFTVSHLVVPREGEPAKKVERELTDQQIRDLIAENGGNSMSAIRRVISERARAARRARDLEAQWTTAEKAGRIAPEKDFVILTGVSADLAKDLPQVVAYLTDSKLTGAKLLELAKKVPELEAKNAERDRDSLRADAAKEMGWDAATLAEVLETKGLALERRDVLVEDEETGKKVKQPTWHTRKASDEKAEWEPLSEYAQENLKIFLPALEATGDDEEGERTQTGRRESRQGAASGKRWPDQSTSRTPAPTKKTDAELRQSAVDSGIYTTL